MLFLNLKVKTLGWAVVLLCLLVTSYWMTARHTSSQKATLESAVIVQSDLIDQAIRRQQADIPHVRTKRQTTSTGDLYPITLNVLDAGCEIKTLLPDFVNGSCVVACKSGKSSCTGTSFGDIYNGWGDLACTGKVMMLGFKKTGAIEISKWIAKSSVVTYKYGGISGVSASATYYDCVEAQLTSPGTYFYMTPYLLSEVDAKQNTLFLHCEDCMNAETASVYFGTLFLDLPTMMLPYVHSSNQKFLITMKNPTDRAIADYFYPYIKSGTDLNLVGGSVFHQLMVDAISDAQACIQAQGASPCIYGVEPTGVTATTTAAIRSILYEGCYSTKLKLLLQEVPVGQVMFIKIEEFSADPVAVMTSVFNFIQLDYAGEPPIYGSSVHKPILPETIALLDDFYAPFNEELVSLLGDNKWLFTRS